MRIEGKKVWKKELIKNKTYTDSSSLPRSKKIIKWYAERDQWESIAWSKAMKIELDVLARSPED